MYEEAKPPVDTAKSTSQDAEGAGTEAKEAAGRAAPDGGEPETPPRSGGAGWRRWLMDTAPLRHPAYRRLWSSTTVTAVGSQLTAVAVPKQIYDITGSSASVGYASLAALVPL